MSSDRVAIISRWFVAVGIVALMPLVTLPYLIVGLVLVGLHVALFRPRPTAFSLVVCLLSIFGLPYLASALWVAEDASAIPTALLAIPGLPWLAGALRAAGASLIEGHTALTPGAFALRLPQGRSLTPYGGALAAGLVLEVLIAAVVGFPALLATGVLLLVFLATLVTIAYRRIPPVFMEVDAPTVRILAHNTEEVEVQLRSAARSAAGVLLGEAERWVRLDQHRFVLNGQEANVRIRFTPPLSGPSEVMVSATAVDEWGLSFLSQPLTLVRLRVIPRAAYAAWLAHRFLEQMRAGGSAHVVLPETQRPGIVRRGLDYYGARPYEPGDILRDVSWKHTLKLNELIIKERRDEYGQAVIMAVNLDAGDTEEADWLAYRLLLSSLTLAREGIPLAFAAYTVDTVVGATPPLSPRTAVTEALRLTDSIRKVPRPRRVLEPAQIVRLRRNITRLLSSPADPAHRLARILQFEYQAMLNRATAHPGTSALKKVFSHVQPPAAVVTLSLSQDDVEPLEITLERARGKGFHRITLPARLGRGHIASRVPGEPAATAR